MNGTANDRIVRLVNTLFNGNQSAAARKFGISQGVLSKIMRDEQVAGTRVLAAIAAHPRVNAQWLYTGEGEPVVVEPPAGPAIDVTAMTDREIAVGLRVALSFVSLPAAVGDIIGEAADRLEARTVPATDGPDPDPGA